MIMPASQNSSGDAPFRQVRSDAIVRTTDARKVEYTPVLHFKRPQIASI